MAEGVSYHVTAHLKMVDKMSAGLTKIGGRVQAFGTMLRGTTLQSAAMYAKIGAGASAAAGAAGLGAMVFKGLRFNKLMEDSNAQIATIFQMFSQNSKIMGDQTSMADMWRANLVMAKDAMSDMYDIAKKSPASFAQVTTLFQNAAAGLATTTSDVGRQMDFVKKAVLAGGLVGGDYQVLGAQVGRMLAGSAGAEMNIWKIMQEPVLKAGKNLGSFGKSMQVNAKLTEEFNRLTGEERLSIMEEALANLGGPVAEYFAQTMGGILSTTESAIDTVTGAMTKKLYDGFKEFLIRANAEGGIFGPENLAKLVLAAEFVGVTLTRAANFMYERIESGVIFLANNWERVTLKLSKVFDTALKAAKLYLKVKFAAAGLGVGVGMVGRGIGMAGGAMGTAGSMGKMAAESGVSLAQVGKAIAAVGTVALYALPAILAVAAIMAGTFVAGLGILAYFVENWDDMVDAIRSGAVNLQPMIVVAEMLWFAMVNVGQVFMGTSSVADMLTTMMGFVIDVMLRVIGTFRFFLKAAGYAYEILEKLIAVYTTFYGAIYTGLVKMVDGVLFVLSTAVTKIAEWTGLDFAKSGAKSLQEARDSIAAHGDDALKWTKERVENFFEFDNKFLEAERAMDDMFLDPRVGQGPIAGFFESLLEGFRKPKEVEWDWYGPKLEDAGGKAPPVGGKGDVNIGTLNVIQDLRDTDPDRLLAAFIDPLKEMADRPKTSYFSTQQGAS